MPRMTGGRFIAETFQAYGVTHVFFMPVIIQRALVEMERVGIRRIMTHSEKSAAYMADGYARTAQRVGVCMSQSVGAANLAAGLQDPYLGCSPVMALTGRRPQADQYRHSYQEIDHTEPFNAVTKYNVLVNSPEQLPEFLRQGFRAAMSGTPGPVHLDLEGTTGTVIGEGEADLEVTVDEHFAKLPPFRPEPSMELVRQAAQVISQARRPVIIAGGGVVASGAQREVVELAEMLSIPVATSLNAKGTIPDNHPLALGVCGAYSRWCTNRAVSEADLVIYLGSSTGSMVTNEWQIPAPGTPIVQIDINAEELGRSYPAQAALQGDAKVSIRKLIEVMEPVGPRTEWVSRTQQLVQEWRDDVAPHVTSDAAPMRPERLCKELSDFLPSDSIVVSDTGHAGIWTGTMLDLNHPDQSYIRCAGSLGWGFPAAMGAKCAAPERPVLSFTGDGGFWYHLTE
ncbi:MAG: thiamine pyrophosphate-binding protein, partial [Chloroflexi bacterium]|nr:thiamine pyrophosphate-binding protein [Chloroflexota bacterium]